MTIELSEGEWELGGVVAGSNRGYDIVVLGAEPGNPVWAHNDRDVAGSSRRNFGQDTEHGPTWTFEFLISTDDGPSARAALTELAAAWKRPDLRAGETVPLRYRSAGKTRRLYGRPRNFAPSDWGGIDQGVIVATSQFVTADPYHYDDDTRIESLTIFAAPAAGFTFPVVFPFTTTPGGTRQGVIGDTGGTVPTPATITFYGPISNPKLTGNGWFVALNTSIAHDKWVTIDTRSGTVLHADGGSYGGYLARGVWLKDIRLNPGGEDLAFSGVDPTGTARAVIEWNPAHETL